MESTHIRELIDEVLSRRDWLKKTSAATAIAATGLSATPGLALSAESKLPAKKDSTLGFDEVEHDINDQIEVAKGYSADPIVKWGDPMFADSPQFNPSKLTAKSQAKQFGYNCDFVAYLPLPLGSRNSEHGLLCVNNEYTNAELMFDGIDYKTKWQTMDADQSKVEMAAHGHSVVEIKKQKGKWRSVRGQLNRRLNALDTRFRISGPAAGDEKLKTTDCPDGRECTGTLNNCAGGVTPWGTVLIAEENFQMYFGGDQTNHPDKDSLKEYGVGQSRFAWYRHFRRFDVSKEPNSPNLYGWIVEYDPYDPKSVPVKRTALGRIRHEGATTALTADGRLVVYSGDDDKGEYFYRFVSRDRCNNENRDANKNLLDNGELSVAKFHKDGTLTWLPLVFGKGPLTPENGFKSQADVLIRTRLAADALGATPMDRPEDAETNPTTGKVYLMLTNNDLRTEETVDSANPRPNNIHGHIIEMIPPSVRGNDQQEVIDHGSEKFKWNVFLMGGDPKDPHSGAQYHQQVSDQGWLSCPDNCTFDRNGRIWISTDGAPRSAKVGDAVYACDTEGKGRALTRQFFRACVGAEICGPCFTPDNRTMFLSIQHPAEGSSISKPTTRWPDFDDDTPPRPSVVAITKDDGGFIGD